MKLQFIKEWEHIHDGPVYPKWECEVLHPIEGKKYIVELKKLETHWRMRVFFNTIRQGHRFMKSLFPDNHDSVEEVQFVAIKHLELYFEEQLAMYNAICILHIGRKYSDACDCDDTDHAQHLEEWQQPVVPYEGHDLEVNIEAYLEYNLCPWCRSILPQTDEELEWLREKGQQDFYQEFRRDHINTKRGIRTDRER